MSRRLLGIAVLSAASALTLPATAAADTVDGAGGGWGELTLAGASQAYTGSLTLGGGFPTAVIASDARSASGVQTGASTFLNANTPIGAKYGTSKNSQYLNLRPKENNDAGPSTTTYTFDSPTPAGGWAFALGDIDADQVTVSATDATGAAVPVAGLGFQGVFNYCGGTPAPCAANTDVPTWDGNGTLTGNAAAADSDGASAWFEPVAALTTLTFTYAQRAGLPIYQTWFASLANDVAGTVTGCPGAAGGGVAGVPVSLIGPAGNQVADTVTAADGSYSFTNFTAAPGYSIKATAAADCALDAASRPVDLSAGDVTHLDFVSAPITDPAPCDAGSAGSTGSTGTGSGGSAGGCVDSGSDTGSLTFGSGTFGS